MLARVHTWASARLIDDDQERARRACVAGVLRVLCQHFERGTQEMVTLVAASEPEEEKGRARVGRRLGLTHTTTRAHHDSLDTGRARAARRTQCRHSASCDDYRRTSIPRDVACSITRLDTTHCTGRTHWVGRTRRCSGTEDTEKPARSPEPCAVVAATPPARPARAQAVTTDRGGSAARPRAAVRAARAAPREVFSLRRAHPQRCRACPSKCAATGRLRRLQGDRRHE